MNFDDYISGLETQANPYDTGADAFKKALLGKQQAAARQFGQQASALGGNLAARGMLGSKQEAGARAALAGGQAAQLADIETGELARAQEQGAQWLANRQALLGQALGQKEQLGLSREQLAQQAKQFRESQALQERLGQQQAWATGISGLFSLPKLFMG